MTKFIVDNIHTGQNALFSCLPSFRLSQKLHHGQTQSTSPQRPWSWQCDCPDTSTNQRSVGQSHKELSDPFHPLPNMSGASRPLTFSLNKHSARCFLRQVSLAGINFRERWGICFTLPIWTTLSKAVPFSPGRLNRRNHLKTKKVFSHTNSLWANSHSVKLSTHYMPYPIQKVMYMHYWLHL